MEGLLALAPQQIQPPPRPRRRSLNAIDRRHQPPHTPTCHRGGRARLLIVISSQQHRDTCLHRRQMEPPRHCQRGPRGVKHNTTRDTTSNGVLCAPPPPHGIGRINEQRHARHINTAGPPQPRQRGEIRPDPPADPDHRIGVLPSALARGGDETACQPAEQTQGRSHLAQKLMHTGNDQAAPIGLIGRTS